MRPIGPLTMRTRFPFNVLMRARSYVKPHSDQTLAESWADRSSSQNMSTLSIRQFKKNLTEIYNSNEQETTE